MSVFRLLFFSLLLTVFLFPLEAQISSFSLSGTTVSWDETSGTCSTPFYYRILVGSQPGGSSFGNSGYLLASSIPSGSSKTFELSSPTFSLPTSDGAVYHVTLEHLSSCGWNTNSASESISAPPISTLGVEFLGSCGSVVTTGENEIEWTYGDETVFYSRLRVSASGSSIFDTGFIPNFPTPISSNTISIPSSLGLEDGDSVIARLDYLAIPGGWQFITQTFTFCGLGVDDSGDPAPLTGGTILRDAIAAAAPGSTICILTDVFLASEIVISKDLTLIGANGATIDGSDSTRLFRVTSGVSVTFCNLTLANGFADLGGALKNESSLVTLSNCSLTSNTAEFGGAIHSSSSGASLTLNQCTITENLAESSSESPAGGGIFIDDGSLEMTGCALDSNNSTYSGTGTSDALGGGLHQSGSTSVVTIVGGSISFNEATSTSSSSSSEVRGAGIHKDSSGSLTITGATISQNIASTAFSFPKGGGLFVNGDGMVLLEDCVIEENECNYLGSSTQDARGGGIYQQGNTSMVEITGGTISGNVASSGSTNSGSFASGGGIHKINDGTLSLIGTTLSNNVAVSSGEFGAGGGINIIDGVLILDTCTLSSNRAEKSGTSSADAEGGGLNQSGDATSVTIMTCDFSSNSCVNTSTSGSADSCGGGIFKSDDGSLMITGSSFIGNTLSATAGSLSGGAYHVNSIGFSISGATVSGNTAPEEVTF